MKSKEPIWKQTADGLVFSVKVIPKSSCNEIVGWENGELKVRIRAAPEKGKANTGLIAFLADEWHLQQNQIQLLQGSTSRHKRLCLLGVTSIPV